MTAALTTSQRLTAANALSAASFMRQQPTKIDVAFEAWRATQPSVDSKVMMLSYLWGLLSSLERDGDITPAGVKAVCKALERHT